MADAETEPAPVEEPAAEEEAAAADADAPPAPEEEQAAAPSDPPPVASDNFVSGGTAPAEPSLEETVAVEEEEEPHIPLMERAPKLCPPLTELCVEVLAANFKDHSNFRAIPPKFQTRVVEVLPTDLPLEVTSPQIEDDYYWQRCATERWKNCNVVEHGGKWKRLYLERNLEDEIEALDENQTNMERLIRTVKLSADYVHRLHIKELKSHMDVGLLFQSLPDLTDVGIVYGHRRVGMDYERSMYGMKNADATCLAKAIKYKSNYLTMVNLSSNLMDDDKLRLLVTGLLDNDTVTHLDVSHNRVADRGARALARLLGETSVITSLNLCDNEVHGEGGKALGRVLARNRSLLSLNLRLNRLGDDGGRLLAEGLRANRALRELNCCGNAFAVEAARSLSQAFANNRTLTWLDLSCNEVGQEGGRLLRDGLENNTSLTAIDLRQNAVGQHLESAIAEALKSAEIRRQHAARK